MFTNFLLKDKFKEILQLRDFWNLLTLEMRRILPKFLRLFFQPKSTQFLDQYFDPNGEKFDRIKRSKVFNKICLENKSDKYINCLNLKIHNICKECFSDSTKHIIKGDYFVDCCLCA